MDQSPPASTSRVTEPEVCSLARAQAMQMAWLSDMAETGMGVAKAFAGQAKQEIAAAQAKRDAGEPVADGAGVRSGMAFERMARTVRLTIAMQVRVMSGHWPRSLVGPVAGVAAAPVQGVAAAEAAVKPDDPRPEEQRTGDQRPDERRKVRARELVGQAIAIGGHDREVLDRELNERLDEPDIAAEINSTPFPVLVSRICRLLGIETMLWQFTEAELDECRGYEGAWTTRRWCRGGGPRPGEIGRRSIRSWRGWWCLGLGGVGWGGIRLEGGRPVGWRACVGGFHPPYEVGEPGRSGRCLWATGHARFWGCGLACFTARRTVPAGGGPVPRCSGAGRIARSAGRSRAAVRRRPPPPARRSRRVSNIATASLIVICGSSTVSCVVQQVADACGRRSRSARRAPRRPARCRRSGRPRPARPRGWRRPAGSRGGTRPAVVSARTVRTSRRIIRPTVRLRIQPISTALRIASPRRWKRQVAKE